MLEIFAAILTLLCVILLKYKNWIGWPIGIVAAVLYGFVFYFEQIYAQTMLQGVFILQSYYGWWYWQIKKNEKIKIIKYSNHDILFFVLFFSLFASAIAPLLENVGGVNSFLDIQTTLLALLANYLLTKSVLQSWYVWILVDIILIGLFISLGLWWTVGLYVLLLMNAIHASIKWNQEYEKI